MINSGIYAIENLVTHDIYVGQTTNFHKRKIQHFCSLVGGSHPNHLLQKDYEKYGGEFFVFRILFLCDTPSDLRHYEKEFIDKLRAKYNLETKHGPKPKDPKDRKILLSIRLYPETIKKINESMMHLNMTFQQWIEMAIDLKLAEDKELASSDYSESRKP